MTCKSWVVADSVTPAGEIAALSAALDYDVQRAQRYELRDTVDDVDGAGLQYDVLGPTSVAEPRVRLRARAFLS